MKQLVAILALVTAGCQPAVAEFRVVDLQVDYETRPMTVESPTPRFSWRMESDSGGHQQSAYEVTVSSAGGHSVWHSGRVPANSSVGIEYAGEPLAPGSRYDIQVRVWDDTDASSTATTWFETGFMQPDESAWSGAQWIGGDNQDLTFWADYLPVFSLAFTIELDRGTESTQGAFLLGGNDFRLLDRNLNILNVENAPDKSFVALELDVSGLESASGRAHLNVYRVGYSQDDLRSIPFASLEIPATLIHTDNRFEPHSIHLDSVFGVFTVYVDGHTVEQRVTPFDPGRPSFAAQGLNINPSGMGGNFIAYPMVGEIGFWMKPGQKARFSNIEIRHFRRPSNVLFAAGTADATGYDEIFLDGEDRQTIGRLDDGAYEVSSPDREFVVLADPSRIGAPMLRRVFELDDKPIRKARLYATARGIYEIFVNGERIGDDYFSPGLSQYNRHHTYKAYDVTDQLRTGTDNAIGAALGEGWWSGNITFSGSNWNYFGDRQSLLAKLVVSYDDGSESVMVSEPGAWRVFHDGPVRYGSFFQGEVYDARRERLVDGWATPEYDDDAWQPARVVALRDSAFLGDPAEDRNNQLITTYDNMRLIGHPGNSPRVVRTLTAQSVDEVRPGVFVYDMGQNMVGFPRIRLQGTTAGQTVILRYSEVLYPDLPEYEGLAGMLMIENLRAALVHDFYRTSGGNEVIQPRFTFHGYRYVEISGIDEAPPLDAVEGLVVSSVGELSADYQTSNPLVNKLWENITWSLRANFLSIPTDTPARNERMGWNGDLNVFARTANYMTHANPFFKRHMLAMRDLQSRDGRFPDVAPVGGGFGGILWGSAGIFVPWETYLQSGDISLLADHYPAMVRYVDFLQSRVDGDSGVLVEGPLGDWLSPEGDRNDNSLLWEAYHVGLLDIMANIADLLGDGEDAARFRQLHDERMDFFNNTYVDAGTGQTVSSGMAVRGFSGPGTGGVDAELRGTAVDTQASYAVPLAMHAFSDANLERAARHLATTVERQNEDDGGTRRPAYSLMTGFIGTASLPEALSMANRDDLNYRVLQQTTYPSWLYPVVNGSTTIWERLNSFTVENGFGGNNSMNSFNHYAFGAVGSWMMSHSLGIRRRQDSPGFHEFVLAPTPDPTGQMTWARGHYDSMYGRIESQWTVDGDEVRYRFRVPDNTTATLHLPAEANSVVSNDSDAEFLRQEASRRVYRLAPGQHDFATR